MNSHTCEAIHQEQMQEIAPRDGNKVLPGGAASSSATCVLLPPASSGPCTHSALGTWLQQAPVLIQRDQAPLVWSSSTGGKSALGTRLMIWLAQCTEPYMEVMEEKSMTQMSPCRQGGHAGGTPSEVWARPQVSWRKKGRGR